MNAYEGDGALHPHFVSIPDPRHSEGVRAYREPQVPHPLQTRFLDPDDECAWAEDMRDLLSSGRAHEADARLSAELAGLDGALARLCRSINAADVILDGWADLLPILGEWEGPPVTAITLGLTNPPDLVFEPGRIEEPELLLSLYSDEAYPFSRAGNSELLAECAKEMPGWIGREEDVEFYCGLSGLQPLNTALIHSKHRYFLRDGRDGVEGRAPGGYVEFVLASWLLATRFLQAVERAVSDHGLPPDCRLICGAVGVNADFVAILGSEKPGGPGSASGNAAAQPQFATLSVKPWVPREDPTADCPPTASTLRQRLTSSEPPPAAPPQRRGFLARLFHRHPR